MLLYEIDGVPPKSEVPQVLAIGKFDGVHIGHQAILDEARKHIDSHSRLAVMCFHPHPRYVLTGDSEFARQLTPPSERARILSEFGVDSLYVVQFNEPFAHTDADQFVKDHLSQLNLNQIVVGEDFRFGRGGKGDPLALRDYAEEMGVGVTVVADIEENGIKVSSSEIRRHLSDGRVERVDALLGRPYTVSGIVVGGDKRGRTIGFPTANLGEVGAYVPPKPGVYAVYVEIRGESGVAQHWGGVLNAGTRPTVNGENFRMEVHLLGFNGDLYGQTCRVSFLHRIRDEMKFESLDHLRQQIHKDCEQSRELLGLSSIQN